ncbi:MAG: hypothetical protein JOZ18_06890 [Chloroflexi bacterium]|nr:hypothetical protein [Chloroflexota bacterium]
MKHPQQIAVTGTKTTFVDVWKWGQELQRLHARIAPRFARLEPRRRALAYLKGIVSAVERKNGWHLAEHTGESRPDGMQRRLCSAVWELRRALQPHVCQSRDVTGLSQLKHLWPHKSMRIICELSELSLIAEVRLWCKEASNRLCASPCSSSPTQNCALSSFFSSLACFHGVMKRVACLAFTPATDRLPDFAV